MIKSPEISKNLKLFVEQKYSGNNSALARDLGMTPQALKKYLDGDRIPGADILTRLLNLGCDINWLLSGRFTTEYSLDLITSKNIDQSGNNNLANIKARDQKIVFAARTSEIETLKELIKSKDQLIESLQKQIQYLEKENQELKNKSGV